MRNDNNYNIRIFIATLLSTILMVLWMRYYGKKTIPQKTVQTLKKQELIIDSKNEQKPEEEAIKKEEKETYIEEKFLKIDTEKLSGSINLKGLVFNNLILNKYKKDIESEEKVKLLTDEEYYVNFGWSTEDKNIILPDNNTLWSTDKDVLTLNNPVTLTYNNNNGVIFKIEITIDENYMFTFKQSVLNNTNYPVKIRFFNKITKKLTNHNQPASVHEGFIGSFESKIEEIKYKKLKKRNYKLNRNFNWAGFTDKYWLVSLSADKANRNNLNTATGFDGDKYYINFESNDIVLNPSSKNQIDNILFTGPKVLSLLDEYSNKYDLFLFDRAVDFGWFYFLTKPIYIILKTSYNFFGNFGVAILFLTFLIKFIMYPFTKKSFVSMAKMKELQPKIDALKSRFSNDKMRLNRELIDLYKKENISPLSGCLHMIVQIPVFFSLYKVLVISIDMRQAPFFGYIKNLAAKDPTTIWNLFGLLPFNVTFLQIGLLPCLMSFTMWLQQKMTAQGNASAETQAVTKYMPLIFLIMFAGMPTGLLIYWTFSNIISIVQQYYIERKLLKTKSKN